MVCIAYRLVDRRRTAGTNTSTTFTRNSPHSGQTIHQLASVACESLRTLFRLGALFGQERKTQLQRGDWSKWWAIPSRNLTLAVLIRSECFLITRLARSARTLLPSEEVTSNGIWQGFPKSSRTWSIYLAIVLLAVSTASGTTVGQRFLASGRGANEVAAS